MDNKSRGTRKESRGNEVEVVWASDEKRGALRKKEGGGNESTRGKEDRKIVGQSELMISRRSDCRLMKCTTIHLPNRRKSGNKMTRKELDSR